MKNWRSSVPVSVHTGIDVLLQLDLVPATQAIARTRQSDGGRPATGRSVAWLPETAQGDLQQAEREGPRLWR